MTHQIIDLRDTTEFDVSAVALLAQVFGAREDHCDMLNRWRDDARRDVLLAVSGTQVVGICGVRLGGQEERKTYRQFNDAFDTLVGRGPMAEFHILAILPEWRQAGLGHQLASAQLEHLRARGATAAVGVCWQHGHSGSSRHLFEGAGFEKAGRVELFYRVMQAEGGQHCQICQPKQCNCAAVLYVRSLTDSRET